MAAEALFDEGRKLVAEGKFADACPKLADSQRLDPSVATLLNLANCYEKLGHLATAWATYREAASAANAVGRQDYVATAQRHADALTPRLARLTLTVAQPVEGLQIRRDGIAVERPGWGIAIPIDPGSHALSATARGYKPWETTIQIGPEAVTTVLSVPPLEALPPEAAPPPAPADAHPAAPQARASEPAVSAAPIERTPSDGRTQRVIGWGAVGLGVVGAGTGLGLIIAARSQFKSTTGSSDVCVAPSECYFANGSNPTSGALTLGTAGAWVVAAGAAVAAAGIVVVLTAPKTPTDHEPRVQVTLAPTLGGALLKGQW